MNDDKFVIQVIARGAFVDDGAGGGQSYMVETYTLRLNHVALNAWILSDLLNCREFYSTIEEWEEHKAKQKTKREAVKSQVLDVLNIDPNTGSACITQSLSEIFTLVHIRKI
jgi:hypothetical protein